MAPAFSYDSSKDTAVPLKKPEEDILLNECKNEAFQMLSAPVALLTGVYTYYGITKGHIKCTRDLGKWPRVIIGAGIGYVTGK